MKVTEDVLNDLLTLHLAGEASADSRALLESHARQSSTFASRFAAAGALPPITVPSSGLPADLELRTLNETRTFIFLRTVSWAAGVFFTLLPLVFTFDQQRIEFLVLGRHAGMMWTFWCLAATAWSACYLMHRKVKRAGL